MNLLNHSSQQAWKLVFIGGMHKCGSTMLASALGQVPQISTMLNTGVPGDEGQHVQRELRSDLYYGEILFGLSKECHLKRAIGEARTNLRKSLFDQWAIHWDLQKQFLIEKSPYNLMRTRFLQSLFPDSYFVIMIRDPRLSYMAAQKTLVGISFPDYLRAWIAANDCYMSDKPYLNSSIEVSFESLAESPGSVMSEILALLGIRLPPPSIDIDQGANDYYKHKWDKFLKNGDLDQSSLPLLPGWTERLGYSLELFE